MFSLAVLVVLLWGVVEYQFGSGYSASFDLDQWSPQKQGVKQRDAFFQLRVRCVCLLLTGRGGALN